MNSLKQSNRTSTSHSHREQKGSVLILCLGLLLILTLIGKSVMETSIIEEKMSINMKDSSCAFEAAEDTLRTAELGFEGIWDRPETSEDGSTEVWLDSALAREFWDNTSIYDAAWWVDFGVAVEEGRRACDGSYVLEELVSRKVDSYVQQGYNSISSGYDFHRATARGVSTKGNREVILEATLGKRWDNKS
jgi:type IV pilus assembly protein PilX